MANFRANVKEDYRVFRLVHQGNAILNTLYLPSFKIVLLFRLSQLFFRYKLLKPFAYLLVVLNDFFHGVWISPSVEVGKGFFMGHPRGLVVNPSTKIGDYCSILQRVSLGGPRILIGNNVSINAAAQIINDPKKNQVLSIGDNCVIAASALVLKSMPENSVVGGMPAKVLKTISPDDNWLELRKNGKVVSKEKA